MVAAHPTRRQHLKKVIEYFLRDLVNAAGDIDPLNHLLPCFVGGYWFSIPSGDLIEEILVKDGKFAVIRPRLTIEKQLAWETIPGWLT